MRPETNPSSANLELERPRRARLLLWPLLAVVVLYSLTFAFGFMASNEAEQRFAAADAAWTQDAR